MLALTLNKAKVWLRDHPNARYRALFDWVKKIVRLQIPTPFFYNCLIRVIYLTYRYMTGPVFDALIYGPAFKARLDRFGNGLYVFGGVPLVSGPLRIQVGDQCRISGQTTFSGCTQTQQPSLIIGSNVDIGWQTTIAVGRKVVIGNNVRIAGKGFLFGYSGHAIDPVKRAQGAGDDPSTIGDIIIEDDVWLGTNVTVKDGITIGQGSIIAAGSVVVHSLPAGVIAAGNPAKIVKRI